MWGQEGDRVQPAESSWSLCRHEDCPEMSATGGLRYVLLYFSSGNQVRDREISLSKTDLVLWSSCNFRCNQVIKQKCLKVPNKVCKKVCSKKVCQKTEEQNCISVPATICSDSPHPQRVRRRRCTASPYGRCEDGEKPEIESSHTCRHLYYCYSCYPNNKKYWHK